MDFIRVLVTTPYNAQFAPSSAPPLKSTQTDKSGRQVTQLSGIQDLIPGAFIHEFLFDPCGYSCNALIEVGFFPLLALACLLFSLC